MKIILVAVTSINGRITHGDNPNVHEWSSSEDNAYFLNLIKEHNLIVMGRRTYEASKSVIKLVPGKLRVIITRQPDKYKQEEVGGQLEFSSEGPKELVERLEKQGFSHMLLAGGGDINTIFLKEHLVSEIYLTIEPKIFGKGRALFSEDDFMSDLSLMSIDRLNEKGTVLLKYKVSTHF